MALTDEGGSNGFYMPVAPAYGGYGNQGGFFGGDWAWIILLLLIGGGGWGFGGGFGGGMWPMMMGGMAGGWDLYPWLNNSQHISDGFQNQQISTYLASLQNSVTSGFADVQLGIAGINQSICSTGNAITGAVRDGFSAAEIANNGRQMANMQQLFGIQSAQQACCCETKAAIADTKFTIATEACATRQNSTDNTQKILDKLCQLELDGVRRELAAEQRENANLRSDLMYARGQASQVAQTAEIRAAQAVTANQLVSELRSCPIPAQPVYGNQPIFTCPGSNVNTGCGCGGFGFNAA